MKPCNRPSGAITARNRQYSFFRSAALALLLAAAFLVASQTALIAADISGGESTGIRPVNHRIVIELYPDKHTISGEVEIETEILPNFTGEIVLNLNRDMDLRSLRFLPDKYEVAFKRTDDRVTISAGGKTPGIIYASFYGDPSVYITQKNSFTYVGKEGCYLSDLCYYFARLGGIEDESQCEMIVTLPEKWEAITQGKKKSSFPTPGQPGRVTQIFEMKSRTRCHTLAAGPYAVNSIDTYSGSGFKLTSYFFDFDRDYSINHLNEADSILKFYSVNYGGLKKGVLKIVEVEKVFPGGYGPDEVVYLTAAAISGGTVDVALLAHEIAHQWFGNLVNCEYPGSNFLNEAFATYATLGYLGSRAEHYDKLTAALDNYEREYFALRKALGTNEVSIEEACKSPGIRPGYQTTVYYRGAFVLGMILDELSRISSIPSKEIIERYVRTFKKKTVSMEDFKKFLLDGNSLVYNSWNRERNYSSVKNIIDSFYHGTAAIELIVNDFSIENTRKGMEAVFEIERTDNFQYPVCTDIAFYDAFGKITDFASFNLQNNFPARKKETYKFKLKSRPVSWTIDPYKKVLMQRYFPSIMALMHETDSVVVYGTLSHSSHVNAFMKELALSIDPSAKADFQFDGAEACKKKKALLIGTPRTNRVLGLIENRLPFRYYEHSISLDGTPYPDENYALRYFFQNPFLKFGVIGVISFESEASLSYVGHGHDLSDYVISLPTFSRLIKGNFKSNISGRFSQADMADKSYPEFSSLSAGFNNFAVENRVNPVQISISNTGNSTESVTLKISHVKEAEETIIEKNIQIPPNDISRFEYPFYASYDTRNTLKASMSDENGKVIQEALIKFKPVRSSYVYLVATDDNSNISRINTALGSTFSTVFRNRSVMEMIPVNCITLPKDHNLLSSVTGILFFDTDLTGKPAYILETLEKFASAGGKVIFSGFDFSRDASGSNMRFLENYFAHNIAGSKKIEIPGEMNDSSNYSSSPAKKPESYAPKPVICRSQFPKPVSKNEKVFWRIGERLLAAEIGKGSFYYIPYDFLATELRYNKSNDDVITEAFISSEKWPHEYLDADKLNIDDTYRQSSDSGLLRWEYFIIFMLIYITLLGPVMGIYLKSKNILDYFFAGIFVITLIFSLITVATGILLRNSGNAAEVIAVTEIPFEFSGKLVRNNYFNIVCGNFDMIKMEFPNMNFIGANAKSFSYQTKTNIVNGRDGVTVNITKPLAFTSNVFSIAESGIDVPDSMLYRITGLLGTDELTVKFNTPFIPEGPVAPAAILKLPEGYFIIKKIEAGATGEVRVPYSGVLSMATAADDISSAAGLSRNEKTAVGELLAQLDQHYTHREASIMIYFFRDELTALSNGRKMNCPRLNIFLSPFTFNVKSGSVIPDFMIVKRGAKYNGMDFFDCSFGSKNFMESTGPGKKPRFATSSKLEYYPKTRKFSANPGRITKLSNSFYLKWLGSKSQNMSWNVGDTKLELVISNFKENFENNGGKGGPLACAFRAPFFDNCDTRFSIICE